MKDFLESLKRPALLKVYKEFGEKFDGWYKAKTPELIQKLVDSGISQERVELFVETDNAAEAERKEIETKNAAIDEYAKSKGLVNKNKEVTQQNVHQLAKEMEKNARRMVIVKYSPNNPTDKQMDEKTAETFMVENMYFTVSRIVPFNVPCEVEYCIAQAIKDAMYPAIEQYDMSRAKTYNGTAGTVRALSGIRMLPKYNVEIWEVDKWKAAHAN